ncbi:MAG TPA: ComF family protein [Bacillota bacterium]|nr:ComF family protein [Bacillota bacterium]
MKLRERKLNQYLHHLGNGLVDLLFPPRNFCPVCGQEERVRNGLGKNCLARISLIQPPVCCKCGRPQRLAAAERDVCWQCASTTYYFSTARAVALYEGLLREILADLKYRYRPDLGAVLGILMKEWIKLHKDFQNINLIIPIPINHQKLMERGYNQAELLAKPLQRYLGISLKTNIIVRDKITRSQNELNKEERFSNIKDAFRVINSEALAQAKVLLIDDILTTGATASEAARILLRAGASDVKVLTLAAGVIDSEWNQ